MPFVTPDAPKRSEVQACIQCGLCLPYCPTYRLTGNERYSPRGRLSAMNAVIEGLAEVDEAFDDALSTCLGCRACEAVCPGLVPYGRAFEGARAELAAQRPSVARRIRKPALGRFLGSRAAMGLASSALAIGQRTGVRAVMPQALRRSMAGIRRLPLRTRGWAGREVEPLGPDRGTVGLLAGCVMDPWFGDIHEATVAVLRRAGYRVVVDESQTCCGALAAHDGQAGEARRLAERNVVAFAEVDLVVSDAAGCAAHLKEYGHWADEGGSGLASRVRDVTELVGDLLDAGVLPNFEGGEEVAMHDPCHLRHAQGITAAPRTIVSAAGHRVVEIDVEGLCCGAAGIYSVLHPDASHELGRRKASQIRGSGARLVASANPGCEMQLRSHLDAGFEVRHPIELYWHRLKTADRYSA